MFIVSTNMNDEWVSLGCRVAGTEEVYYGYRHVPCGTEIEVLQGYGWLRICPKCDAERWTAEYEQGNKT
jgi:hypothetical protein